MALEYRSRSVRLDDECWEALRLHDKSANQLLRGALGLGVVDNTITRTEAVIERAGNGIREAFEAPVDNRPKNATCKHCGERFAGAKWATVCSGCKSTGHTGSPADCPRCGEGGTGAL